MGAYHEQGFTARLSPASSRPASNARRTGGVTAFASTSFGRPATTSTCSRLSAVQAARFRHDPRWPALASDREIAGQIRLVELAAGARGGRRGRDPGHLGPVPLRLARSRRPGRAPIFRSDSRISRSPRWKCSSRSAAARRIVCPLNEINFLSWAVDDDYFPHVGPDERGWFKRQLVRTAITAAKAIKQRWPDSTIVWAEPLIHIAPHDRRRETVRAAQQNLQGMYEAYDWIMGLAEPELGGDPSLVDVVGLNFYPHNQWYHEGPTIPMGHHEYRPLADMLVEMAERYQKPVFLSETGAEGIGQAVLAPLCLQRGARRDEPRRRHSRHLLVSDHRLSRLGQYTSRRDRAAVDRSSRTAAATSTSACSRSSRCSARCSRADGSASVRVAGRTLGDRRGSAARLTAFRRTANPRAIDAVDQQDPAAVDLVLLPLARAVHVDRMIDDPVSRPCR